MDLEHFVLFCYICVIPVHKEEKLNLSPVTATYNSVQSYAGFSLSLYSFVGAAVLIV